MKKTLKFLALALCILPCVILLTACGEPKIRNVYTKLGSDSSISRNMGVFKYTTDANQPALQELNKLSIVIEYTDDSKVEVGLDDSKVKSTITYEGNTIDSLPSVLDVGSYTIKYYYDNSSTYAEVYFFVEAGNISYTITSLKNTWEYLDMPYLAYEIQVPNYNGADSITEFYYIDIPTYNRILEDNPDAFTTGFYVPDELQTNLIDGTTTNTKIPVGDWYLFAYVPYTNQYEACLTEPFAITVTKSELNSLVDNEYSQFTLTAEYAFDGSMLNDVSLSDIAPEVIGNINAYNSDYPDTHVSLTLGDWANPNQTLNCSSADKQAAVRFTFASEEDARNYTLTDAAYEQTINVELQKGKMEYPSFAFVGGNAETKTQTITEQKKNFEGYELIDGLYIEDFTDSTSYYNNYFNVVEFYDVTNEGNAQNINIYYENGNIYKNNNYSGPIKIVLKQDGSQYVPTVEIVDNAIGTYKIELRIKDKVNYEWGFLNHNYGTDNLTLTIDITKNSVYDSMYIQNQYVAVDKDGYGEITALVPKEYFENMPTSEEIDLISEPYQSAQSNVTITEQSIVISDNGDGKYKIVIKNKYEFEETTTGSYYLCYKLTITTSDDYENIEQQNQLEVLQFVINPGTDYSGSYSIPKCIDHYATISQQTIDNNTETVTIEATQDVKSVFANLTSAYGTWKIQYEESRDSYQELTDGVALTSGNTLKIKLLYEINSELEELNTQLSHIVVGVAEINFTLTAQ